MVNREGHGGCEPGQAIAVCSARAWRIEEEQSTVVTESVADVGGLVRVGTCPRGTAYRAVGIGEYQRFAVGAELEVNVQFTRDGAGWFAGGKEHEVGAASDGGIGEGMDIVASGKCPAVQIDRGSRGVVQLDPVGELASVVGESGTIGRHELVDDDRRRLRLRRRRNGQHDGGQQAQGHQDRNK